MQPSPPNAPLARSTSPTRRGSSSAEAAWRSHSRIGQGCRSASRRFRSTLGCGSITGHLVLDSDGSALDLLGGADVAEAWGGHTTPVGRPQLEALRKVISWRIETNDRIVLEGGPEVILQRVPK